MSITFYLPSKTIHNFDIERTFIKQGLILMKTKKYKFINLYIAVGLVLITLTSSAGAQILANKYDTKNHSKAKGVWMTVRYPEVWQAKEGERPNIVQKFVGDYRGVDGMLMLQIKTAEADIENECKEMSAKEWGETFEEPGITVLNPRPTRHENQPSAILDFSQFAERAGMSMHGYYRVMAVCYKRNLIMAWCGCVAPTSAQKVRENINVLAPLCTQYFNSVVLMDKYK